MVVRHLLSKPFAIWDICYLRQLLSFMIVVVISVLDQHICFLVLLVVDIHLLCHFKISVEWYFSISKQALPARSSTGKGFVVEVPVFLRPGSFLRPSPVPISKSPELMGKPPVFIYTQQKMRVRARRACFLLHIQNHSDVTYRWPNLAGFRNMLSSYLFWQHTKKSAF